MIDLINDIDETVFTCLGRGKSYGLCRLIEDDKGAMYPVTVSDGPDGNKKVTPEDKWKIVWYHRLINSDVSASEDLSFGRSIHAQVAQRVRTVVVVAISEGQDVINEIISALPDDVENVDYKYIQVGKEISLIVDQKSIWEAEWGNAYKDKHQMRYYLYALEYSIDYIKCDVCVSD